jgi:hypothetical protein
MNALAGPIEKCGPAKDFFTPSHFGLPEVDYPTATQLNFLGATQATGFWLNYNFHLTGSSIYERWLPPTSGGR